MLELFTFFFHSSFIGFLSVSNLLTLPIGLCKYGFSSVSIRKASRDISEVWEISEIFGIASAFSRSDAFVQAMTDMGPPEDWGVLSLDEDQRYVVNMMGVISYFIVVCSPPLVIVFLLIRLKLMS